MSQQLVSLMTSIICLIMGVLFILGGLVKLVPYPQVAYHAQVHGFRGFASVFPLKPLGIVPDADTYRITVGIMEIILGFGMILPSNTSRRFSAIGLGIITLTAATALVILGQYSGAVITAILLVGLLWVYKTVGRGKIKKE